MDLLLPTHIAIIPDGNRRWAKKRGLPSFMGHREGAKTTKTILKHALDTGITHLTFWGASINNVTKRDAKEVQFLFKLFTSYFKKLAKSSVVHKNGIRIRVLGRWSDYFPKETKDAIKEAVNATKKYTERHLTFLLAYNGTEEMVSAVNDILKNPPPPRPSGDLAPRINESDIKARLYTHDLPPVDLVIRTGGEPHLSAGFMMWDIAEAQLYFSDLLWPAFSVKEFDKALDYYSSVERRNGK